MSTNYYDVVVLGSEFGPLAAGALLAKRGFRVLVVGQNAKPNTYQCFQYKFLRRPFLFTSHNTPAVKRVINELGIGQLFQHTVKPVCPTFQLIYPNARVNVFEDPAQTRKEILRESPKFAPFIETTFTQLGKINGEIDKLLASDLVLPPETFFEKREFARAEVQNPFRAGAFESLSLRDHGAQGLAEFLELPVRFETAMAKDLPPIVRCRTLAGWLFNAHTVVGGRDGLVSLLAQQIINHGGDVHTHHRIGEIIVNRGRVLGVRNSGSEDMTGCQVILTHLTPRALSSMIAPKTWTKRFRSLVQESPAPALGYACNLGVDAEVVPAGLANTALVSDGSPGQLLRIEKIPQDRDDLAALHVSCVLPPGDPLDRLENGALRDDLLDRARKIIPFLDNYLQVIHSPFDGFGPIDLQGNARGDAPMLPHPEEVEVWHLRPPVSDGILGVENLPHRTGIKGLLLAGDQVTSGIGVEGEFIAAWGAARIAGKMDPQRERLVRSMRSKVEI